MFLGLLCFLILRKPESPRASERSTESITIEPNSVPSIPTQALGIISKIVEPLRNRQIQSEYRAISFGRIDVSGVVIDQFDQPLPNVSVEFVIDQSGGNAASSKRAATTTDGNGIFKIAGFEGTAVAMFPKADGYLLLQTNNRVIYSGFYKNDPSHFSNDGTNRVIRMWKLQGGEDLVRVSKTFRFSATDAPIYFDLVKGELTRTGGDIKISIERPAGNVSIQEQAQWAVTFSSVDGGIQQTDDLAFQWTYQAPTNGYQKDIRTEQLPRNAMWSTHAGIGAFVVSRHGKIYSKVGIGFDLNEEPEKPCWVRIHSLANPNASRNWEEDPTKIKRIEGK